MPPVIDADDATDTAGAFTVPDFRGLGVARALDMAREAHLAVTVSGSGHVVNQDPPPGPAAAAPVRITLKFSDGPALP